VLVEEGASDGRRRARGCVVPWAEATDEGAGATANGEGALEVTSTSDEANPVAAGRALAKGARAREAKASDPIHVGCSPTTAQVAAVRASRWVATL
jgi:hypothetical protein